MTAFYKRYILDFKRPSGTSRGILKQKETWFLVLKKDDQCGIGECGLLRGLSIDDLPEYEQKLRWTCDNIHLGLDVLREMLHEFPSIQFGIEQAFLSLTATDMFELFPSGFTQEEKAIQINGLIWMGDYQSMKEQVQQKLSEGFRCIKFKIGAIDFKKELSLLESLRGLYSEEVLEIRVDANGAFSAEEAMDKLNVLSEFDLHSIEQPIRQGNMKEMQHLCSESPLPIALDEELIGVFDPLKKEELLRAIRPQYIILKPSLIGGYRGCEEWISVAEKYDVGWWITSALESNIGLNAISQWVYTLKTDAPQGLGTGGLYGNNIESPLTVQDGHIFYDQTKEWNTKQIQELCI